MTSKAWRDKVASRRNIESKRETVLLLLTTVHAFNVNARSSRYELRSTQASEVVGIFPSVRYIAVGV